MKYNKKDVVIIIPTHRSYFNSDDKISLKYLEENLHDYDIFFVIPKSLNSKQIKIRGYKYLKVDDNFFGSIRKYSNLLLYKNFYENFKNYKYMLIYQLDALVLSEELLKWINSGYDYIGAPWFRPIIGYFTHKKGSPSSGGNGGLSIRNIEKCIKILDIVNNSATRFSSKNYIQKIWFIFSVLTGKSQKIWLKAPALNYPFYEDGFWALEAPKYYNFKVAPFKIALQFCFERFPIKCFKMNNNKLPFSVHAWKRYDENFWEKHIKGLQK